jgi:hypothetical protein
VSVLKAGDWWIVCLAGLADKVKLRINRMANLFIRFLRYFFIAMYVWLEKYFSRGDFKKTH